MKSQKVPESLKRNLGYRFDEPIWEEIDEGEIEDYLSVMDDKAKRRILFTLRMQRSTEFALKILRLERIDEEEIILNIGEERWSTIKRLPLKERNYRILGEVMNIQHSLLRDLYDLSLPKLEKIFTSALEAGAYGAKISGAGMGGSIIALVKDREEGEKVVDAGLSVGAKNGWFSKVGEGVKVEPNAILKPTSYSSCS